MPNKGPAPPGGRNEIPEENLPAEALTSRIVKLLNAAKLAVDQADRIATIAASRARRSVPRNIKVEHILTLIDGAQMDKRGAKLVALRALVRAQDPEPPEVALYRHQRKASV